MPVNSLEAAFGSVVRDLRMQAGMSQEALSFACSRHRTYVSLIERGRNSPTIATLWRLAGALDISPTDLVQRVEQELASRGV